MVRDKVRDLATTFSRYGDRHHASVGYGVLSTDRTNSLRNAGMRTRRAVHRVKASENEV